MFDVVSFLRSILCFIHLLLARKGNYSSRPYDGIVYKPVSLAEQYLMSSLACGNCLTGGVKGPSLWQDGKTHVVIFGSVKCKGFNVFKCFL